MANNSVPAKQAILPSRLFFEPRNLLLPKVSPTTEANVSPIAKNEIDKKAISAGKTAMQTIDEVIK